MKAKQIHVLLYSKEHLTQKSAVRLSGKQVFSSLKHLKMPIRPPLYKSKPCPRLFKVNLWWADLWHRRHAPLFTDMSVMDLYFINQSIELANNMTYMREAGASAASFLSISQHLLSASVIPIFIYFFLILQCRRGIWEMSAVQISFFFLLVLTGTRWTPFKREARMLIFAGKARLRCA